MSDKNSYPFQSFSFSLLENRRPRTLFRLSAPKEATTSFFQLLIQKGSATNPTSKINREVPIEAARDLRDALQQLGVFGWEESYGDTIAPGSKRWSLSIIFEEGVFSLESKGGSDTPPRFNEFLEELYRLDFPRPAAAAESVKTEGVGRAIGDAMGTLGVGSIGAMNAGDLGAYAATKGANKDYSYLKRLFSGAGSAIGMSGDDPLKNLEGLGDFDPASLDGEEVAKLFAEMQQNPQAMQTRLREEFRHLSSEEQNRLLDALASSGTASRAWWERFLRGF